MAQGSFYELRPDSNEHDAAVGAIRDVIPQAFTVADPFPDRQIVYGLHVTEPRPRHGDFF